MSHHHALVDWSVHAVPALRKFKWQWAYECDETRVLNVVRGREVLEELQLHCAEGMMNAASGLTDNLLIRIGKDCPHMHRDQPPAERERQSARQP